MNRLLNLKNVLGRWLHAISPPCKEVSRLQSESLEHKLPALQRFGVRFHLALCKWCRRYGRQMRFLRVAARSCEEHEGHAPQKLSPEARERIRRKLQTTGK